MKKLRIFVVDDHAVLRDGLKLLINSQPDMEIVGEAGDGETACRQIEAMQPDVVLMDVSMPHLNGAQATERLKTLCPQVKVVVLTGYADAVHVRQLLKAGAVGYVLKRTISEELTKAIRVVMTGGTYLDPAVTSLVVNDYVQRTTNDNGLEKLSAREAEVLADIARGYTNREVAERLHLSIKTVETHKARSMEKLELSSRADLVRLALRQGWLQDD